ncbi:MAG: hypothetical protein Tp164SUR323001_15 [Prokaryotic dsDNA virus sp.]|nr:MAG: hypothetical protein Tp164SUR323001_15 [Prokaryotic dsDNA virus sp.]|tara:strand:+ start:165 stop:1091 length:927 start_codon:yes stop_codon:yes gene_type:complete
MANKKYNFADSVTSNYAGEAAAGYISAALLSGTTMAENNITFLNNVKYKANLRKITIAGTAGNLMADATCGYNDSGTLTYAERVLEPRNFDVNMTLCKQDYLSSWEGANMTAGLNGTVPQAFGDYIIGQTAARVSAEIEKSIWDGTTDENGQFDGFRKLLLADADVNDVAGATTLSAANIVAEIGKVMDTIPTAVYGKEDLRIFIPTSAYRFYQQAQAALGYANLYQAQGEVPLTYVGIQIAHAPGLADNTIVAGRVSNMFMGTDGSSSEVKLLDMANLDGSDEIRVVMRFTAGINYAFGSDMVLYAG